MLKYYRKKVLCKPRVREVTLCRVNLKLYEKKDFMEKVWTLKDNLNLCKLYTFR